MDISAIYETIEKIATTPGTRTYILAGIGALISGYVSLMRELKQSETIPLAFSEQSRIIEDSDSRGTKADELTMLFTSVNDVCMQIFEAHNLTHNNKQSTYLGEQLNKKYHKESHGNSIKSLISLSKEYADKSLDKMETHFKVNDQIKAIYSLLNSAWDESHVDHYKTEYYHDMETYTDGQGRTQTRLVLKSRQVYDYTQHTYDYDKSKGVTAAKKFLEMFNDIKEIPQIWNPVTATAVSEEGKKSSLDSRKSNNISEEEYLKISRTWCDGTLHDNDMGSVPHEYSNLEKYAKDWDSAKDSAKKHYSYITYSSSDNGPQEYQTATKSLRAMRSIESKIGSLKGSVGKVKKYMPALEKKLERYFFLTKSPGLYIPVGEQRRARKEARKLKKEILSETKEIYSGIFKEGIDVDRFKEWRVALWSALGAAFGVASGFFLDYISN